MINSLVLTHIYTLYAPTTSGSHSNQRRIEKYDTHTFYRFKKDVGILSFKQINFCLDDTTWRQRSWKNVSPSSVRDR